MISKERLEQLIEQGATIYLLRPSGVVGMNLSLLNVELYEDGCSIENKMYGNYLYKVSYEELTEDRDEAEWYGEFGCIERTERLELPTWEEFNKMSSFIFENKDRTELEMAIWFCDTENVNIKTIKITNSMDWNIRWFELPLTKENYTLACRRCKDLFLGVKDEKD